MSQFTKMAVKRACIKIMPHLEFVDMAMPEILEKASKQICINMAVHNRSVFETSLNYQVARYIVCDCLLELQQDGVISYGLEDFK